MVKHISWQYQFKTSHSPARLTNTRKKSSIPDQRRSCAGRARRERMRLLSLLDEEKEEDKQRDTAKMKRLDEAAMKGSVPSLIELLQEDPDVLDKTAASLSDTPLHIASLLGHSAFARELLSRKPEFAVESDSNGSSPLHVAAAKGYLEIVQELLSVNPEMCLVKDGEGRTPLHLGAVKGRVGVLTEMVRVRPEAIRVLTDGGESGLHLCVKYNRFEALKVLVDCLEKDDQLVNWRDSDGNTLLHLAVAKKQLEIIKYLLANTKMEVNARTPNGFTALDLLLSSPGDLRDMEIKECLQKAGALTIREAPAITNKQDITSVSRHLHLLISKKQPVEKHKHTDWLGRKRSALMVVASLLATVAYQASVSPPGGVWQDDYLFDSDGNAVDDPHKAGLSVMAKTDPKVYRQFMIFNTIAFLASLSVILLLVSGLPMKRRRFMWTQMVIMWIAISALSSTYFIALTQMTPQHVKGTLVYVTRISMLVWLCIIGLVFVGNVVRMTLWLLRKYGYIKKVEKQHSLYVEDEENDDL